MSSVTEPSYRQRNGYHAALLGGICCMVSVVLIIGNQQTSARIAAHLEASKRSTLAEVLPSSLYDNELLASVRTQAPQAPFTSALTIYTAELKGQFSGAALQSSVFGWGGDIQFIAAINGGGEITGVRVLGHKETPGLADKIEIRKDDWIESFNGKSLVNTAPSAWAVRKDGGEFDQFTGATITPRALVAGVHAALQVLDDRRYQHMTEASAATAQSQEVVP